MDVDEFNTPKTPMDLDEDLHSRNLAVYGRDAMRKMAESSVLIIGMNGVGAEVAKDVLLAGIRAATLADTVPVQIAHLSSNFYLAPSDVGKNRAEACAGKLAELNPAVNVRVHGAAVTDELIREHSVVVCCEGSLTEQLRWSSVCRSSPTPVKFVLAQSYGVFGSVFSDFGDDFTVADKDGEEPGQNIIASISSANPCVISVIDDEIPQFDDGDVVSFREIVGMPGLNKGEFKVKEVNKRLKLITLDLDTTEMGSYESGGIAIQMKQPVTFRHKSFESALREPGEFNLMDFSKFDRPPQQHVAFWALGMFKEQAGGALPRPGNAQDAAKLVEIAKQVNGQVQENYRVEEVDAQLVTKLGLQAAGDLSPMAAFLGGIVAQEVLKAVSHKYSPISQFLYYDCAEALPDPMLPEAEVAPLGTRYDGQVAVFGKSLTEKMMNSKVFLVGSGALGCEFLKNYAMMGVSCGPDGKFVVTDDDVIEKSNLSRQFLFRNWNLSKPKSEVAAAAVQQINPDFKVNPLVQRVSPDTENIFNDEFWESMDCVTNALDNVNARLYVDSKCLYFRRALLESGTLGTKCNTQCIIPDLTENYGSSRDPPEKQAPMCVIHSFPHSIDHCLVFARSEFQGAFDKTPGEANGYLQDSAFASKLRKMSPPEAKELMQSIVDVLIVDPCKSYDDCVQWARKQFEDYNNKIRQLIHSFPEDAVTQKGSKFWLAPKRFPNPQVYDAADDLHQQFVGSAALLKAVSCNIPLPEYAKDFVAVAKQAAAVSVEPFVPRSDVKIDTGDKEADAQQASSSVDQEDDSAAVERMLQQLNEHSFGGYAFAPQEFEKDDDTNFHMDFISSLANLRARCYRIDEVDKLRAKLIAGNIIPAIATATAIATGLVCMEFYKLAQGKKVEDYRNSYVNLAISMYSASEPTPPKKQKFSDMQWSDWDRWILDEPDVTLEKMFKWLEAKGLTVGMASFGSALLYTTWTPKHQERLPKRLIDLVEGMQKLPAGKRYADFVVACEDSEGNDVDIPIVSFRMPRQ